MNSNLNKKASGREAALARRKAQSSGGKQNSGGAARERTRGRASAPTRTPATPPVQAPVQAESPAPAFGSPAATASPVRPAHPAAAPSPAQQSRARAAARREALSRAGRTAAKNGDRTRAVDTRKTAASSPAPAEDKKQGCNCGCKDKRREQETGKGDGLRLQSAGKGTNGAGANGQRTSRGPRNNGLASAKPTGRLIVLARRSAMSARGKSAGDTPTSAAGLARQANPKLSGRELAQRVRDQRSKNGGAGERKSQSSGRVRAERRQGVADQFWKVGASETTGGQVVTGTRVGRSRKTTGDEPSTCRNVTGTEYLGAEIFRDFCQTVPSRGPEKVQVSATSHGNAVTGNEVGRSTKVTGDEPGTCKSVTGTEYLAPHHQQALCDIKTEPGPRKVTRAKTKGGQAVSGVRLEQTAKVTGDEQGAAIRPTGTQYTDVQSIQNGRVETAGGGMRSAPPKVGKSVTLSGGTVTGTRVGRSAKVTGDEPGSCRVVTGDEYADLEQYQSFCDRAPAPEPPKVGLSMTSKHRQVSGTQTGRSGRVTGDEPGTCKAVTGTPYAGLEQASDFCAPDERRSIEQRSPQLASTPGPSMTGIQPGIGGVMTGAAKGACESLTGTPYVGRDQFAETCGGAGAQPGDGDFPRPLDGGDAPWESFSVMSPARQAYQATKAGSGVTGTRYETGNQITGPFDMGVGKITGTEQFRFDARQMPQGGLPLMEPRDEAAQQPAVDEPPERPRITGEGQSAGSKITGDDWDRGDRVTGTEGASAKRRNPTRPGPMSAMPPTELKRNEEVPAPVSRVTGSSGNTERGALVTYSGGARG